MKKSFKLVSQRLLIALGLGLGLTLSLLGVTGGRLTPSARADNLTVTKTTDTFDGACDADCSIRDAFAAANVNAVDDTVTLLAGTYVLTLTGAGEDFAQTGDLDINDVTGNLTLIGNGAIIDGAGIGERVLDVLAGQVTISDLTVQNGSDLSIGGGVRNRGSVLTLTNVTVISNTAPQGGGIYNDAALGTTRLTLVNSTVTSNTASGDFGWGGGILNINGAVLTLISSTVSHNRANFGINGFVGGGGIANVDSATLINSLVSQNIISTTDLQPGGGGIDNHGVMTLTNTIIRDNLSNQNGGGIWNDGSLSLTDSSVSSNTAQAGHGGGVYNVEPGVTIPFIGSDFASNTAGNLGGGFYNEGTTVTLHISASNFVSNTARFGGALYNSFFDGDNFNVTINNSAFVRNSAILGGGALSENAANTVYAIAGSSFINNTATKGTGGALNHISLNGRLSLTNTTLSGNQASQNGGAIFLINADTFLDNVTIANNVADSDGDSSGDGGGLVRGSPVGTFTLANTIVAGNLAASGPDISGTVVSAGYNLIQDPTGATIQGVATGNISNTAALLGPLTGAVAYHPLLFGSPAIDAGNDVDPVGGAFPACAATDQRGQTRPIDGNDDSVARCDIGAYEAELALPNVYLPIILRNGQ